MGADASTYGQSRSLNQRSPRIHSNSVDDLPELQTIMLRTRLYV